MFCDLGVEASGVSWFRIVQVVFMIWIVDARVKGSTDSVISKIVDFRLECCTNWRTVTCLWCYWCWSNIYTISSISRTTLWLYNICSWHGSHVEANCLSSGFIPMSSSFTTIPSYTLRLSRISKKGLQLSFTEQFCSGHPDWMVSISSWRSESLAVAFLISCNHFGPSSLEPWRY